MSSRSARHPSHWNPSEYTNEVRDKVKALEASGVDDFADVCRRSGGAFPSLIARFSRLPTSNAGTPIAFSPGQRTPYPSPARGEWYFTRPTSKLLVTKLGNHPLLLGAPSVAEVSTAGTLVDSSPWISERFSIGSGIQVIPDAVEVATIPLGNDSALIDPPWYGTVIESWLRYASAAVTRGGPILVPLMGELTRPTARRDRQSVIDGAKRIGRVVVISDAIEYDTPLFECCAMDVGGVHLDRPWRISDLLIVMNDSPVEPDARTAVASDWMDYRVDDDIISARMTLTTAKASPTAPSLVEATTLDDVSRRHPALRSANLWSSRNRVARATDISSVMRALSVIESNDDACIASDLSLAVQLKQELLGSVTC